MNAHANKPAARWMAIDTISPIASRALLLVGVVALAFEPTRWLLRTWYQPGYDGFGGLAFALVVGLFLTSWRTELHPLAPDATALRTTRLLMANAALRLTAQILDINMIGALLLCVDVYALAHLARLGERRFAVSPVYLAGLFCFCLPIEPIVQRLLGYGLQHMSAYLACGMLNPWFADLVCEGVRVRLNDVDVLVDLPCSGAELLSLSGLIYLAMASVRCPGILQATLGAALCLLLALIGNGLRIAVLAVGIAFAQDSPVNVMDPVPHAMVGLIMVALVTLGLLAWYRRAELRPNTTTTTHQATRHALALQTTQMKVRSKTRQSAGLKFAFALLFFAGAVAVDSVQPTPIDASPPLAPPTLPRFAGDHPAHAVSLTPQEQEYFAQFGGSAARAAYGPYGLLVVSTTSPLRHLHDPLVCLSGLGYQVRLLGTDHATSSTLYRATKGPHAYLIRVTYQAEDQRLVSSVSEVIWRWLDDPGQRWTMIQRIEPLDATTDPHSTRRWQAAIRRAFNLA